MVKPEWSWMFFNEEWNERDTDTDGGDEDFIDSVDVRLEVMKLKILMIMKNTATNPFYIISVMRASEKIFFDSI